MNKISAKEKKREEETERGRDGENLRNCEGGGTRRRRAGRLKGT